jgi:hypothetical protein
MTSLCVHCDGGLRNRAHKRLPAKPRSREDVTSCIIVLLGYSHCTLVDEIFEGDFGQKSEAVGEALLQVIDEADVSSCCNSDWS